MSFRPVHLWLVASLALGSSCGTEADGSSNNPSLGEVEFLVTPARRLTRYEYTNSIRDLVGDETSPGEGIPKDIKTLGFDNNLFEQGVSVTHGDRFMRSSEEITERLRSKLGTFLDCSVDSIDDACARSFIEEFGSKVYRRPLAEDEVQILATLYTAALAEEDAEGSLLLVVQAMLQSPQFLYRLESSPADAESEEVVALDDYEIATRLSYLFWNSTPDDELLAAAARGELRDFEGRSVQVERMLSDPKAEAAVATFHRQWLGLDKLGSLQKNLDVYPNFDGDLALSMEEETIRFVQEVLWNQDGSVEELLTADYTFANGPIAELYGAESAGNGWERIALDATQRSGLLTHPSIMSILSHPTQTSAVHRGMFVRERMMCETLAPPPNELNIMLPTPDPNISYREKMARHFASPDCQGCHVKMDPVGLGFEHFDSIGQWRNTEGNDIPISGEGFIVGTPELDGYFYGPRELGEKLAGSEVYRRCMVRQWFRYGFGREELEGDKATIDALYGAFSDGQFNLRSLLRAMSSSDLFLNKAVD